jgi:hypothetical protein
MTLVLRIILVLLPIIALFLWLRWRAVKGTDAEEEFQSQEMKRIRIGAAIIVGVAILAGFGLRYFDDSTGDTDLEYVPPHVENGKVVPGHFVPKKQVPADDGPNEI